ncbi:MAG: hypothetical protein QM739_04125 [Propionivibrio sp.]
MAGGGTFNGFQALQPADTQKGNDQVERQQSDERDQRVAQAQVDRKSEVHRAPG